MGKSIIYEFCDKVLTNLSCLNVMVIIAAFSFLVCASNTPNTSPRLAAETRNTLFNPISHPKKGFLLSTNTPGPLPWDSFQPQ